MKWHRQSDARSKLAQVPGIVPITASALVASLGDAKNFDGGRQVAAWLGLVPKQHSSGGKQKLLSISKRGDTYLRTLLIHGARSVIYRAQQRTESCGWINGVVNRRNKNVAAVAFANKMRASFGHCRPTIECSGPTTQPPRRPHSQTGYLQRARRTKQGELNHRLLKKL